MDLVPILERAWSHQIRADAERGLITTEHDLQCGLYHHLRGALADAEEVRISVERIIRLDGILRPNLCVFVGNEQGWMIELKVQHASRAGPRWKDDVKKFVKIDAALRSGREVNLEARGTSKQAPLPSRMTYLIATLADESCEAVDHGSMMKAAPELLRDSRANVFWAAGIINGKEASAEFIGPLPMRGRWR